MPGSTRPTSIEASIRAARERGEFEELPGRGKPLEPDDLDGLAPEERFEARMMRSLGEALPELALVREIREARRQLTLEPSERNATETAIRAKIDELRELLRARSLRRAADARTR